jgi:hypothetical protein
MKTPAVPATPGRLTAILLDIDLDQPNGLARRIPPPLSSRQTRRALLVNRARPVNQTVRPCRRIATGDALVTPCL